MLENNPSRLKPSINGLSRSDFDGKDVRILNNYGIEFQAKVNGVISAFSIFSNQKSKIIVGLANKQSGYVETGIISEKVIDLNKGWNRIEMLLPIEQGVYYMLYKKFISENVETGTKTIQPWNSYPFKDGALTFLSTGLLGSSGTFTNYTTYFDIEVITSLSQIYYLMNKSVVNEPDIYVGNDPPPGSKFWFKPIGS